MSSVFTIFLHQWVISLRHFDAQSTYNPCIANERVGGRLHVDIADYFRIIDGLFDFCHFSPRKILMVID